MLAICTAWQVCHIMIYIAVFSVFLLTFSFFLISQMTGSRWNKRTERKQRWKGERDRKAQHFIARKCYITHTDRTTTLCVLCFNTSVYVVCWTGVSVLPYPVISFLGRERMVSQGPKGRWEQREMLETMGLQVVEEKMELKGPKGRWVLKEKPAPLALLERRFVATVY